MGSPLTYPLVWIAGLLFGLHQISQKVLNLPLPLIDDYLDPIAGMILILAARDLERERFRLDSRQRIPEVLVLSTLVIVLFEGVVPVYHSGFTADLIDVPMYLLGTILYLWLVPAAKPAITLPPSVE